MPHLGDQQDPNNAELLWTDSKYKFTKPIRYYKSNDPYYWEVDNIPIKQLEENILWLKDQVAGPEGTTLEISRSGFSELKPKCTGQDRVARVNPGKYIGRVNDAYNKGLISLTKVALEQVRAADDPRTESKLHFNIDDSVFRRIVGEAISPSFINNGLFDHLQHHSSETFGIGSAALEFNEGSTLFTQNLVEGIGNLPKNKLALWKPGTTAANYGLRPLDLQQLSVEFTRRWGGVARTSVVNIEEELNITIPEFSDDDFINQDNLFVPQLRFDLLFVYTHPIDSVSTTLPKPSGGLPTTITQPILGLVKGAGAVRLQGFNAFGGFDTGNEDEFINNFFDSPTFDENINDSASYFKLSPALSQDVLHTQILAPIAGAYQSLAGIGEYKGNFPSPDDLMNLTPLLQEGLEDSLALIGQSILPLAYIVTRKGQTNIRPEDIIDIRPFFRTSELSYNERSGIAASNPPLSLANPAVGRRELFESTRKIQQSLEGYVNNVLVGSFDANAGGAQTIAKGTILGGTKWGPEGALLVTAAIKGAAGSDTGATNSVATDIDAMSIFNSNHLPLLTIPAGSEIPERPGWDLGTWLYSTNGAAKGSRRNDYIQFAPGGTGSLSLFQSITDSATSGYIDDNVDLPYFKSGTLPDNVLTFVKKSMRFSVPPGMRDYTVKCNFVGCVPATSQYKTPTTVTDTQTETVNLGDGTTDQVTFTDRQSVFYNVGQYNGIFIEKGPIEGGYAYFTIYVAFPGSVNFNSGGALQNYLDDEDGNNTTDRDSIKFTGFRYVSTNWSSNVDSPDAQGGNYPAIYCTYPTVEFTIQGHGDGVPTTHFYNSQAGPSEFSEVI